MLGFWVSCVDKGGYQFDRERRGMGVRVLHQPCNTLSEKLLWRDGWGCAIAADARPTLEVGGRYSDGGLCPH